MIDLIFCCGVPTLPPAFLARSITLCVFRGARLLTPAFVLPTMADPGFPVRTEGLLIPGLLLAIIDPFLRCVYIREFDTDILLFLLSVSCLV